MSEHTKEPWRVGEDVYGVRRIWSADFFDIAACSGDGSLTIEQEKANARRIVACVNYCAGKTLEELERAALPLAAQPDPGERVREACAKVVEDMACPDLKPPFRAAPGYEYFTAAAKAIRALPLAAQPEGK